MAGKAKRRSGRGRLSSIDTLPDQAQPAIEWALEALRDRKLPQTEILEEFNRRLDAHGLEPISASAFNRYAVRKAIQFRQLDEARRISSELVAALGADGADDLTIAVGEMLKLSAMQILEGGGSNAMDIMSLAKAIQAATSAQKTSAEHRTKIEQRIMAQAAKAIEATAKEGGLSKERVAQLRREFLGVKTA